MDPNDPAGPACDICLRNDCRQNSYVNIQNVLKLKKWNQGIWNTKIHISLCMLHIVWFLNLHFFRIMHCSAVHTISLRLFRSLFAYVNFCRKWIMHFEAEGLPPCPSVPPLTIFWHISCVWTEIIFVSPGRSVQVL
jgi:hypothetical protein